MSNGMPTKEQLDLFFFDWKKPHDEYRELYVSTCPDRYQRENERVRYSPIYLLLRDIRHCYGVTEHTQDQALFAGVVLSRLAIANLATLLYGKKRVIEFVCKYYRIDNERDARALNELRNALEHSFYGLYAYVNEFDKSGVKSRIKYYYATTIDSPKIIDELTAWSKPKSRYFIVNVHRIYSQLITAIKEVESDLRNNADPSMSKKFAREFVLDRWVSF